MKEGNQNMRRYNSRRKKYRIKSKPRFITSMIVIIALFVCGISTITGINISTALTEPQYEYVNVKSGDTLWDIADKYKSEDTDIRRAVFEISKANNDIEASELYPGMVISVPVEL